ncbi:MAG: glycosyltransferase family 4 protein, partial [Panacibacter sp.]
EWVKQNVIAHRRKIWGIMEASSFFQPSDKFPAKKRTGAMGSVVYLFVGRLDKNKDPLTVIKAFLQFRQNSADVRLYLIYHTIELLEEIRQLLINEKYGNSIVLVGEVFHDDMAFWYNSADFIISGSHYEGSGVAVCEAMSCGCIPILTDILSFKKISANGHCGLLYEPGNTNALLSALLESQQMNIEEERQKVLEQFARDLSFEAIAAQIDARISSL